MKQSWDDWGSEHNTWEVGATLATNCFDLVNWRLIFGIVLADSAALSPEALRPDIEAQGFMVKVWLVAH
jgi:hypothetical protein